MTQNGRKWRSIAITWYRKGLRGEIVGGVQREDDYDTLLAMIRKHGLDEESFKWYLICRSTTQYRIQDLDWGQNALLYGFACFIMCAKRFIFEVARPGVSLK